ncbi:hypothetical protein DFS34DRAFT_601331 [Phlyctochytrium arcticum]|nr:hypothetical protein DFS34DRAFT_601331 [Phlyctochytrium arcticum]
MDQTDGRSRMDAGQITIVETTELEAPTSESHPFLPSNSNADTLHPLSVDRSNASFPTPPLTPPSSSPLRISVLEEQHHKKDDDGDSRGIPKTPIRKHHTPMPFQSSPSNPSFLLRYKQSCTRNSCQHLARRIVCKSPSSGYILISAISLCSLLLFIFHSMWSTSSLFYSRVEYSDLEYAAVSGGGWESWDNEKQIWWDKWIMQRIEENEILTIPIACTRYTASPYWPYQSALIKPDESEHCLPPSMEALELALGAVNSSNPPSTTVTPALPAAEKPAKLSQIPTTETIINQADKVKDVSPQPVDVQARDVANPSPHLTPHQQGQDLSTIYIPIPKRIFFLHYNPKLTVHRYLCAIESAARINPDHVIMIYAANVFDFETNLAGWRREVGSQVADRVHVRRLQYASVFKNTPLEPWFIEKRYRNSSWVEQNLGNAFRLAKLYHDGGVYFDMDIISLNPLDGIGRSAAREQVNQLNNAALSFPPRDPLLWLTMENFVKGWNGNIWGNNGPGVVTRTFVKTCPQSAIQLGIYTPESPVPKGRRVVSRQVHPSGGYDLVPPTQIFAKHLPESISNHQAPSRRSPSPAIPWALPLGDFVVADTDSPVCQNLNILRPPRFYPIHYTNRSALEAPWDENCDTLDALQQGSVGLHWWHKMVGDRAKLDRNSLFGKIMRTQCPGVVRNLGLAKLDFD